MQKAIVVSRPAFNKDKLDLEAIIRSFSITKD